MYSEARLQFVEGEALGVANRLAANIEGPIRCVDFLGRESVVSHEESIVRRDVVVEEVGGGLGVDRAIIENHEPIVLAGDPETLRGVGQGRRDQPCRHMARVGDVHSEHRAHRGQPSAVQEAAAGDRVGTTPPNLLVRVKRVLVVEIVYPSLVSIFHHGLFSFGARADAGADARADAGNEVGGIRSSGRAGRRVSSATFGRP